MRGEDPLLLLGTDLLTPRIHTWGFLHVGYQAKSGRGLIAFTYKMGEEDEMVELAQAPGALVKPGEECLGFKKQPQKKEKGKDERRLVGMSRGTPPGEDASGVCALLRRGQRL